MAFEEDLVGSGHRAAATRPATTTLTFRNINMISDPSFAHMYFVIGAEQQSRSAASQGDTPHTRVSPLHEYNMPGMMEALRD
jgi:hypothetical protein